MRIRTGQILFLTPFAIGISWVALVTSVYWGMDPKFGGPYRWATFVAPSYWVYAWLPSTHLALLAIATRFRWRQMAKGAFAYRHLRTAGVPGTVAIMACLLLTLLNGGRFEFELVNHSYYWVIPYPWEILLNFLIPVYVILLVLMAPVPGRAWLTAGIGILILFFGGGLLLEWLTETTVTPIENGVRHSRVSPGWAEPFEVFMKVTNTILFAVGGAQFVINVVFWSLFLVFRDNRDASSQ